MKNSKLRFKTADEAEAVFYAAFMRCDSEVIAGLWADEAVLCVHPGSGAILDHAAVIRSWRAIFSNARRTDMNYTVISRVASGDLAVHVVVEEMLGSGGVAAIVLATNVYRKCTSGWLMVEHHASLVQNRSEGQTLQ